MHVAVKSQRGPAEEHAPMATEAARFYGSVLEALVQSGVPFLVGGALALRHCTRVVCSTKGLDVFCRPADVVRVLEVLRPVCGRTEVTEPMWLAKAFCKEHFTDVIFRSRNGLLEVDDSWFAEARRVELLGVPVMLMASEEMLWSKAFVQARGRFDGADIAHLLLKQGAQLNWRYLLARMEVHWEVLLSILVNFRFAYPSERDLVPAWVLRDLLARLDLQIQAGAAAERVCRGTLFSERDYGIDIS